MINSAKRIFLVLAVFVCLAGIGYTGAWIVSLFPKDLNTVLVQKKRIIKVPELREVTKWKTKVVNVPVKVYVPTPKETKKIESEFGGQIHLDLDSLIATGNLKPSESGFKLAVTIPKEGGKAVITAVEKPLPLVAFGGDRSWYIGPGFRAMARPGEATQLEPILSAGLSADALCIRSWRLTTYFSADYGTQNGWTGRVVFGVGHKSHFGN